MSEQENKSEPVAPSRNDHRQRCKFSAEDKAPILSTTDKYTGRGNPDRWRPSDVE